MIKISKNSTNNNDDGGDSYSTNYNIIKSRKINKLSLKKN